MCISMSLCTFLTQPPPQGDSSLTLWLVIIPIHENCASLTAQQVKKSAYNAGDRGNMGLIPGLGRSPEEEMAIHSSILAWKIPWKEEPGGLQCMKSQRVRHNWKTEHTHTHIHSGLPVQVLNKYLSPFCNLQHTWAHTQKGKKRRNGSSYKLNMFLEPSWKNNNKKIIAFLGIIHRTHLNKQWWCYWKEHYLDYFAFLLSPSKQFIRN